MNTAKLISVGEKAHYPFKSYPSVSCETVLFPGCAFPSQFPRTMDALAALARKAGMGVAYDCCGLPLVGYDEQKGADRIIRGLNRRFAELGVKRVVLVCPNCLMHLSGQLDCEVLSIYDVFDELGLDSVGGFAPGCLFVPCPDKDTRALERKLREIGDLSEVETMERVACCGLRADIALHGPQAVEKLGRRVISVAEGQPLYTYCASCLGHFSRLDYNNCRHVLSVLLGVDEQPDSGRAFLNRAKRKLDRNTNPL